MLCATKLNFRQCKVSERAVVQEVESLLFLKDALSNGTWAFKSAESATRKKTNGNEKLVHIASV